MERYIPWEDLVSFLSGIPRSVLSAELEAGAKLTSGTDPLPEDWCLRGMEWSGRRVYERGFWARSDKTGSEMELLLETPGVPPTDDGIIEDDSDEQTTGARSAAMSVNQRRWTRTCRSAAILSRVVPGFTWDRHLRKWTLGGVLAEKSQRWMEEDRIAQEERMNRRALRWADDEDEMDVDEAAAEESESSG